MDKYLEEYIKTLSDARVKKVHQILKENSLDYRALQRLVITAVNNPTPSIPTVPQITPGSTVWASSFAQDFSVAQVMCADYESVCNQIALILNSNKELHQDTILDLSNKLCSLERLVEAFAFLYGGDPGYSYSWSDSFDDESQREDTTGESNIVFIDRDGTEITERASINAAEGTLTLGSKSNDPSLADSPHEISLESCNARSGLLQEDPVVTITKDKQKDLAIKADFYTQARVSSPLLDSGQAGVQLWVKYKFQSPVGGNCLIFGNRSMFPVEVLRIQGFGDEEDSPVFDIVYDPPVDIFSNKSIYFPAVSFRVLKVLFNQRNYRIENFVPEDGASDDNTPWDKYILTPLPSDHFYFNETDLGTTLTTIQDSLAQFYQDLVSRGFREYGPNTVILHKIAKFAKGMYYHYELYLTNPRVRLDHCYGGRGIFITKPIRGGNLLDQVALQTEEEHPLDLTLSRQSPRATSIEYYITANNGAKWVPIRPSNLTKIYGERVFPDINGVAYPLFPFKKDSDISEGEVPFTVYRNGIQLEHKFYEAVVEDVKGYGVAVSLNACVIGGTHRYTVDYTPATTPVVSCEDETMKPSSGSVTDSSFRLAIVLRSNSEFPTSPLLYKVQIKGKVAEVTTDE